MDRDNNCPISCAGYNDVSCCEMYFDSEVLPMNGGITKDTFRGMSTEDKLNVMFDYMHEMVQNAPRRVQDRDIKCAKKAGECKVEFQKVWKAISRNRILNSGASMIGGFIGGWSAVWAAFKLGILGV